MELKQYSKENPWRGLLSYREGEILYGRDDDIRDLTQCVLRDKYTLLYGKSGIGKSSILNSAIIPALRRNGFTPIVIRLSHREGNYIEQIHKTISETIGENGIHEEISRKGDKETLYEYLHRHTFWKQDNTRAELFLLFDQFEEIFTLQTDETVKKFFFSQLEDLCNDIRPECLQPGFLGYQHEGNTDSADNQDALTLSDALDDVEFELPNIDFGEFVEDNEIRMIFTIREDFLSEFDYYTASIPLLKQNRYYLRPINEEQAAQIIMRPCPGLVSEEDAWLIISKVTNRTDFKLDGNPELTVDSAVLSLYMSRLFESRRDNEHITKALIEMHGDEIISGFYKDAISSISSAAVDYLEDNLLTGQGRRDNITEFDAINDGHVSKDELELLVNEKKILRRFNYAGVLRIEYVHDILCPVVTAHREERRLEKQQEEELQELLRQQKTNRKKIISAMAISVAIALGVFIYLFFEVFSFSNYYANFTTKDGFPVGIGPKLLKSDKEKLVVHYKLTRHGFLKSNPYIEVQVINSKSVPTTNVLVESPAVSLSEADYDDMKARNFARKQKETAKWKYERDENDAIMRQVAYDVDDKTLYSLQYFRDRSSKTDSTEIAWMVFLDSEGKPLKIRNNGLDRMRVVLKGGYQTQVQFFSESGVPQKNGRNVFGYRYKVNPSTGQLISTCRMDEFGETYNNNILIFTEFDKYGRWKKANIGSAEYGIDRAIYHVGNRADSILFEENGRMTYRSEQNDTSLLTFAYDNKGQLEEQKEYSNAQCKMVRSKTYVYYDDGELHKYTEYSLFDSVKYKSVSVTREKEGTITEYKRGDALSNMNYYNNCDNEDFCCFRKRESIVKDGSRRVVTSYYYKFEDMEIVNTKQEVTYDNDLLIRRIESVNGKRNLSVEYEIENGIVVGRHVIGIMGDTIRCPQWDEDGLNYYRLRYVRDFSDSIVAYKAINEWGEESLITKTGLLVYCSVIPERYIAETEANWMICGVGKYKISLSYADKSKTKKYIHIVDTNGYYYWSGFRDGDIILREYSNKLIVARRGRKDNALYHLEEKELKKNVSSISGAEIYNIFLTEEEYDKIKTVENQRSTH